MRYSDTELFDMTKEEWSEFIQTPMRPIVFFDLCIDRLQNLIIESTKQEDWMTAKKNHLRTYRQKAVEFYREKIG